MSGSGRFSLQASSGLFIVLFVYVAVALAIATLATDVSVAGFALFLLPLLLLSPFWSYDYHNCGYCCCDCWLLFVGDLLHAVISSVRPGRASSYL